MSGGLSDGRIHDRIHIFCLKPLVNILAPALNGSIRQFYKQPVLNLTCLRITAAKRKMGVDLGGLHATESRTNNLLT